MDQYLVLGSSSILNEYFTYPYIWDVKLLPSVVMLCRRRTSTRLAMQASKAVHALITNNVVSSRQNNILIHKQYCDNSGLVTSETMYTENKRLRCTRQKRLFFMEIRTVHHRCREGCERKQARQTIVCSWWNVLRRKYRLQPLVNFVCSHTKSLVPV